MKKAISIVLILVLGICSLTGCGNNDNSIAVNSQGEIGSSLNGESENVVRSVYGDVRMYPLVQEDINIYIDDSLLPDGCQPEVLDELKIFVNAYADATFNIDENYTGEKITGLSNVLTAEKLVEINRGLTEDVTAVQLLNVAFNSETEVKIAYAIKHNRTSENEEPTVRIYLGKSTLSYVNGKWIQVKFSGGGYYNVNQYMIRDAATNDIYIYDKETNTHVEEGNEL